MGGHGSLPLPPALSTTIGAALQEGFRERPRGVPVNMFLQRKEIEDELSPFDHHLKRSLKGFQSG